MNTYVRAMISSFIATVILSVLMLMKSMMGFMPGLDVVRMLAGMAHDMMGLPANPAVGWVLHFMTGTVLWGIGFALLFKALPGNGPVIKGIVFGVLAWLLMMLIPMSMAGAGLFGMAMGIMVPVMTLVLHLIWGTVLGATYGRLSRSAVAA
ncbi:hypothetical protein LRK24_02025 [Rhodanobacter denitrificans]|uniref:DUF6789 family protein n=1 Tax=Rhodanobacter denitrificans TaxID=666685 RepID=UPI000260E666|nr:DUF6789 family protein [Rhodanobacter denitrificans]EIL99495.1 hypothetical protein UUC_15923 [Rhodanobacter denitrificans]UJM90704.1 hypothetical protein LRK24_02025 [Rhodanobacter denitrificans]